LHYAFKLESISLMAFVVNRSAIPAVYVILLFSVIKLHFIAVNKTVIIAVLACFISLQSGEQRY